MKYDYNEIYRYIITMPSSEEDKYYLESEIDHLEDSSSIKSKFDKKLEAINLIYETGKKMG
eukprot:jgi/Orpsp1_1/1186266/evm.model.d7180000049302.1